MPRIPNAANSDVKARTSGTTEATIAPNATSRMRKVRTIVSTNVESSPDEISSLMSLLMNVLLTAWIASSGCAARALARTGRTGASNGPVRSSITLDAPDDPDRRPVRGDQGELGWRGEWVGQLLEGRRLEAVDRGADRAELADQVGDRRLEGRIGRGTRAAADHDEELLVRVVRAAGVEDVVGLARFERLLVRVLVRGGGIDAAHRDADQQESDREQEPQADHRPAVTGAPHRDADRGGFSTGRDGRRLRGHRVTLADWHH